MQIKTLKVANIKADAQENIISGYASFFNNKDSHGDIITKGAFTKTIQENKDRIKVLWQHDLREPIGKPIDMIEDEKGLFTTSKISQTDIGKKAMILARDGVLNEMSIGFYPIKEDYDNQKQANMIKEIKLMEYSLVTLASNPMAQLTDVKHLLGEYEYSKGNIMDIVAIELLKSIKALVKDDKPVDTTLNDNKSLNINNDEQVKFIMEELKKYL